MGFTESHWEKLSSALFAVEGLGLFFSRDENWKYGQILPINGHGTR